MKYVHTKKDFPRDGHFAALLFSSIYIPGDERSQNYPGHGYPAKTRKISEYITFDSFDEMEQWESRQTGDYCVFQVDPLVVKQIITTSIQKANKNENNISKST